MVGAAAYILALKKIRMFVSLLSVQLVFLLTQLSPGVDGLLDGSLLGDGATQSCTNIYGNDGDASLQCNQATVLELELTANSEGGGIAFLFQNTKQNSVGGGPGSPACDGDNPGTCVGAEPFFVNITVGKIQLSYSLDVVGIEAPFAYAYSSCLTRSAGRGDKSNKGGAYPDTVLDECGPTMSYNTEDFNRCDDDGYAMDKNNDLYSECIFMCAIDKQRAYDLDDKGKPRKPGFCSETTNSLDKDYRAIGGRAEREHLACKEIDFEEDDRVCFPHFPIPKSLCPCAGGANMIAPIDKPSDDGTAYVPATVCKSGTCAGTCGTAINVNADALKCDGIPPDECCDATDPTNFCANTGQKHRCLKCQPQGRTNKDRHYCYYMDLNIQFRCSWSGHFSQPDNVVSFEDWCGTGDYVSGGWFDPTHSKADSARFRESRTCNCDASFVEKIYPVAPLCNTYIIRNPARLEYEMTVTFSNLNGELIQGSQMTVGSGWASHNVFPPNITLPLSQFTSDGFALTRIISADSATGKQSNDLHGLIVMCDNGNNPSCTISSTDTDKGKLPSTGVRTSSGDCRTNPWTATNNDDGTTPLFTDNEARVPLPDMIYRYANSLGVGEGKENGQVQEDDNSTWWYYVPHRNMENYGRGCGQIGSFPSGDADAGTARAMCNGPIGTCVPGIDTLQRGEIIDPPCNVAGDWYKFVKKNGGTSDGSGCLSETASNKAAIPRHVPVDWDPQNPQYYVCGGRLMRDGDDNTGTVNIHATISIAADFQGEIITQSPGRINTTPRDCSLFMDTGTGKITVSVDNTGSQTAQYTLTANCTQGIIMKKVDGVTFSQGSGSGGAANTQVIGLSMQSDVLLTPSAEDVANDVLVPACTVRLFPSGLVAQGHERDLDSTIPPIKCIIDFALPLIYPEEGPDLHGASIGKFIPSSNGTTCSILNPLCVTLFGGSDGFFSARQHEVVMFFVVIFFLAMFFYGITKMMNLAYGQTAQREGFRMAIEKNIRNARADRTLGEREFARRQAAKQKS